MDNFVSPHVHPQSLDTGSTPESFVKRAVELGLPAIACTDHGSMSCCRNMSKLAKKAGIHSINGLEAYVRDDNCSILTNAGIEKVDGKFDTYNKYYHLTLHARDHAGYKAMVRGLTFGDTRAEQHGSERKPLFDWRTIEDIGAHNVTATSSCLVGMVSRHLLAGRIDLAIAYYEKLRASFKKGNFYVELFPHVCDTYWEKAVFVKVGYDQAIDGSPSDNNTELRYWFGKKLKVVSAKGDIFEMTAEELAKKFKPGMKLIGVKNYSVWEEKAEHILDVRAVEGFLQNECTPQAPDGDVQKFANVFLMKMAQRYGDPILVSDDSHLAYPDDKPVQDVRLLTMGDWRFASSYHMYDSAQALAYFKSYLGVTEATFEGWVQNSLEWASGFRDFKFEDKVSLPTSFYPQETLQHLFRLFHKHGRYDPTNKAQTDRVKYELQMLHYNGKVDLLPYLFMGEDFCSFYEKQGHLSGPGRGSAGGLLVAYLLGITHVDPLRYELSADRFLTADRVLSGKMPDIDMDFPDREPLLDPEKGYLHTKFGDCVAQISTDTLMRLKSSIKDIHRVLDGRVSPEIEALTKKLPIPPQGITDKDFVFGYTDSDGDRVKGIIETDENLIAYATKYPEHWKLVVRALGLTRTKGRHASAYCIMDQPVGDVIPLTTVGGFKVTADTAAWVEQAGGIKIDILGVNSLKDIEVALKLIRARNGGEQPEQVIDGMRVPALRLTPFQGRLYDVWDLPQDEEVMATICRAETDKSIFQFGGDAAKQYLSIFTKDKKPLLKSVADLATFTALARPGPLDAFVEDRDGNKRNMLEEFAHRAAGGTPCGNMPVLDRLLPETYGIIAFQEQLMKAFKEVGQTTGQQAEGFRVHTSKKMAAEVIKDKELFMPGATKLLGARDAQKLWDMLETFANYGFNKSHAVAYSHIGYACAWLRHHYPLEWWTAVLSNANRNDIDNKFWKYCGHLVLLPDVGVSGAGFQIEGDRIRAPLSMLNGVGPAAHGELQAIKPYTSIQEFCDKVYALKLARAVTVDGKTKLGRSALNRGIMTKLILSGAADSLFPAGSGVYDKLVAYSEAFAKSNKKRKPEPVDPRLVNLGPLERYLLKKQVLPAHSEELVPTVQILRNEIKQSGDRYVYITEAKGDDNGIVPIIHGKRLSWLVGLPDATIRVAVVGYISEVEWFWNNKAAKVYFDVNGEKFKFNMWPERGSNKAAQVPKDAIGSVAILCCNRYMEKEFSLDAIVVVQAPINLKEESQ